jgi:photosystem II stability/assembly factor-like uncharacterized protein
MEQIKKASKIKLILSGMIAVLIFAGIYFLFSGKSEIFTLKPEENINEINNNKEYGERSEEEEENEGELSKNYLTKFYLPKSPEDVSEERERYLEKNGSLNNLGEVYPGDQSSGSWTSVGPKGMYDVVRNQYYTGPLISLDMYGDNPNILYTGGQSGGLWKSTDASNTWFNIVDTLACPTISSIACTQLSSDNTIWFSTGSTYSSGGAATQIGRVYKSTNGGTSFVSITNFPANTGTVNKIEINPFDKNRVFIASQGGLFKTTNGGTSFSQVFPTGNIVSDVITYTSLILPDTTIVLMGVEGNGIWRSTNGGNNFSLLTLPGYNTATDSRITLATNPSAPNRTFALVGRNDGNFLGLWFSTDKGATWIQKTLAAPNGAQSSYNQGLATTTSRVFWGLNAREIFTSDNDGATWNPSPGGYTHEDIQRIHPYSNTVIYQVNDGGINRSTNSGNNWSTPGAQFISAEQCFGLHASSSLPNTVWIGTYHTGLNGGYDNLFGFNNLSCCDAGKCFEYAGNVYMTLEGVGASSDARLQRAPIGSNSFTPFAQGLQSGTTVFGGNDFYIEGTDFYTSVGNWAYKRSTSASLWGQLGLTSPFGAAAIGRLGYTNGYTLAGSSDPNSTPIVKRHNPSNSSWENVSLTGVPAGVVVTDFEKGSNVNNVFMSVSGTSGARIFKSTNNGSSWTNITGNLPNLLNVRCILANKTNDLIIYIGTDFGVYATGNGGINWYDYSSGLPKVIANCLAFENNNNNLYVGTFGRGVFKSGVLTGIENSDPNIPSQYSLAQNYPNPFNPSTTISFDLPVSDEVTIEVFDISGRLVNTIEKSKMYSAGSHSLRFEGGNLSSGVYFYRITTPRFTDVKKMILVK